MTKDKSLIKNVFNMGLFQLTNYLVPLLIIPLLLQRLGLENYGYVVLGQGIMLVLIGICDFGFNMTGTRLVSQLNNNKKELSKLVMDITSIKSILLLFCFVLLVILVSIIPSWRENRQLILFSYTMVIGQTLLPLWYFEGMQKMAILPWLNLVSRLLFFITILVLVKSPSHSYLVNFYQGLSVSVVCIWGYFVMLKNIEIPSHFTRPIELFMFAKSNISIFFSNFLADGYRSAGILIAGFLFSPSQLGLYGVLDKLLNLIMNGFAALFRALMPRISSLIDKKEEIRKIFKVYYLRFGVLIIVGLVIFTFGISGFVTYISNDITPSELKPYVIWLSIIAFVIFLNIPFIISLVAFDLKREYFVFNLVILCCFLAVSLSFGPVWKINGLLIAHSLSHGLALIFAIIMFKRKSIRII